jgi:putative hydrolase of the HAD superfamily
MLTVVRGAVFDLYDTLVYVDQDALRAKFVTCARFAGVAPDNFRRAWFVTSEDSIRGKFGSIEERVTVVLSELGRDSGEVDVGSIADAERSFLRTHVHPFPDARDTLQTLRRQDLKLAIVTNASASVAYILDRWRFYDLVDAVVISSEVKVVKPNPEIYIRALELIDIAACEACYIGDGNDRELDGAKAVGMYTILVRRDGPRYGLRESSSGAAADVTVETLAEIPAHVWRASAGG